MSAHHIILHRACDKKLRSCIFLFIIFISISYSANAQLQVTTGISPHDLIRKYFAGGCARVSNIVFTGDQDAIGYFNGTNSNIGLGDGVLLTSGKAVIAIGPNNSRSAGYANNAPGDADLDGMVRTTTYDAAVLEFDFISLKETASFDYVFASEEYEEFVGSQYNDCFGFFVSGPGINGTINIALVPGMNIPVSINNVNQILNSQYYVNNDSGKTVQYDGFTKVLTASIAVVPCTTYHMKLAVADARDRIYDSGVFLKTGSFIFGLSFQVTAIKDAAKNGCTPGVFTITRYGPITTPIIVKYNIGGSAINGVDYQFLPGFVTIPAGQSSIDLHIYPLNPGSGGSNKTVAISVDNLCSCAPSIGEITILEPLPLALSVTNDTAVCSGTTIPLTAMGFGGGGKYKYQWSHGLGTDPNVTITPTASTDYIVTVTDTIYKCSVSDTIKVTALPLPQVNAGPDILLCKGSKAMIGGVATNGTLPYQYRWNPVYGLDNPNIATPIAQPALETMYIVTVTSADGCVTQDSVTVTPSLLAVDAGADQTICEGTSVTIGGDAIEGALPYTYSWSPTIGLSDSKISMPIASPTKTTRYIETVSDANGCIVHDTVLVKVNPKPIANITPRGATTICEDSSVVLDAGTGFIAYSWSTGETSQTMSATMQGIYTVTVWDSAGCEASASLGIKIIPKPYPVIIPNGPIKFCKGDSVILTTQSGYNSYRWSTGESTQKITVKKSGEYTVTVSNNKGCFGKSDPLQVQLNADPMPIITGPAIVCKESKVTYSVSPFTGHSFSWSVLGGTITSQQFDELITVRWGDIGTGFVKVTLVADSSGCIGDTILPIDIRTSLSPIITADKNPACMGDSVRLEASIGYKEYLWSNGAKTQKIFVTQPGDYWVEGKDTIGCRGKSQPITITMYPLPTPTITASGPTSFCEGDSVTLDAGEGYNSYKWINVTDSLWREASTKWIVVKKPGKYVVTVTDTNSCHGTSDQFLVIVNPNPDAMIIGPSTVCENTTVIYSVINIPNASYSWMTSGGTIIAGNGTNNITVQWGLSGSGKINVLIKNNSTGCSAASIDTIAINTSLQPIITAMGPTTFCEGDSIVLDGGSGFAAYSWNNGVTTRWNIVTKAGSYFVTVTDSNGCSGTSQSITTTIITKPNPVISGPAIVCTNTSTVYSTQFIPGANYIWNITGGTIVSGSGSSTINVLWGSIGIGTVKVQQTIGSARCSGDTTLIVTISTSLKPTITADGPTTFCDGGSVTLDAGTGYTMYNWNTGEHDRWITVKTSGSYSVEVTDAAGCKGTSQFLTITVNKLPTPSISANGPVQFCEGDSVTLSTESGYKKYQWNNGSSGNSIHVKTSGVFFVTVTDTNGCNGKSSSIAVVVFPRPVPMITQYDSTLTVTSIYFSYQWYVNGQLIPDAKNQSYDPIQAGNYFVLVTDEKGCKGMSPPLYVGPPMITSIALPIIEAAPGEKIVIDPQIHSSKNLYQSKSNDFTASIRFNKKLLIPTGNTPIGNLEQNERLISFTGSRSDTIGSLAKLEFIAMLTNIESTPIHLEEFHWTDKRIRVLTQDGEFRLRICREGGARLVNTSGKLSLSQNRPNPYNAMTMIEYEIIEKGRTQLFVLDMLCRRLTTIMDAELNPGRYELAYDADALSSGTYFYMLQTPSKALYKIMHVVK